MDTITEIGKILKAARVAKGLSQRALAKIAGVPQSHISKIETAGVDLRVSSLSEMARALDLELELVPRKAVPAVKSIMRSTKPATPLQSMPTAKELKRLLSVTGKIALQNRELKEAAQLQSRVHDLTRFKIAPEYLSNIQRLNKQLEEFSRTPNDLKKLADSLSNVEKLRNILAHSPVQKLKQAQRSAYSLEEEDNG
jgi:transcriptional regulator with XRE-family HTH domain